MRRINNPLCARKEMRDKRGRAIQITQSMCMFFSFLIIIDFSPPHQRFRVVRALTQIRGRERDFVRTGDPLSFLPLRRFAGHLDHGSEIYLKRFLYWVSQRHLAGSGFRDKFRIEYSLVKDLTGKESDFFTIKR